MIWADCTVWDYEISSRQTEELLFVQMGEETETRMVTETGSLLNKDQLALGMKNENKQISTESLRYLRPAVLANVHLDRAGLPSTREQNERHILEYCISRSHHPT